MRAKVWPKWIGGAQAALSRAVDFFGRVAKISPWMAEGMIALAFGLAVGLAAWSGGHPAGLESATLELLTRATRGSALSKALGKHAFYAQIDMDQSKAYSHAVEVMAGSSQTHDAQERMRSFLEKREAVFLNR